jgi:aldehyde dehydrogenase (NAD+)
VHSDANLKYAAARLAYAKFVNAGQTCVAADHLWVHRDVADELLRLLEAEITGRYGSDPRTSPDLGRIVNSRHAARIRTLLDGGGYDLLVGGDVDVDDRYVAPTVVKVTDPDAALMGEEIFGPVLPVLVYDDLDEPIKAIRSGDKPLALYVFTSSDEVADRISEETSSGGLCVNDVMLHVGISSLPFGGVGASGYGSYHGRWGVETFSHRKAVLRKPSRSFDAPMLRPPYKPWKKWLTRKVL